MINVQGGPFSIFFSVTFLLMVGFGLAYLLIWLRHQRSEERRQKIEEWGMAVEDTKALIYSNDKAISVFVHTFGEDLVHHFSGEAWLKQVSIHDLRMMAETAMFNLVKGCPCGECAGVANGGPFAVEASYSERGVSLRGIVTQQATLVELAGEPRDRKRASAEHSGRVTMICAECTKEPVEMSIDTIGEGKRPVCSGCMRGARA